MREQDTASATLTSAASELHRFLYRPIVFVEPGRVVDPPSWLEHIPFAFWIVEATRPRVFVELGTQSGNSYAAFAQAIQWLDLPTSAYAIDTWRGDEQAGFYDDSVFAEWERYHSQHFSPFSRLIRSTFEEALTHFADRSIDLLHIDGCHTYDAVSSDYAHWLPKLSDRGIVLFHDTNVRERDFGAWRLWEELRTLHPSFEFLHGHGLGVLGVGRNQPPPVQWLFSLSSNPSETSDARAFFARIGQGVAARFRADVAETALARERAQHQAAAASFAAQLGDASEAIARLEAHVRYEHDQAAALRHEGEHELERIRNDAELRIADEARRREAAESALSRAEEDARVRVEEARRERDEAERALTESRSELSVLAELARRRAAQLAELRIEPADGTEHSAQLRAGPFTKTLLRRPRRLREARVIAVSGLFDPAYYRSRYPDVAAGRMSPLAHFVLHGGREGRAPHPLFDAAYYLRRNPDVATGRVNPLAHYLRHGAVERRNPSPLFDVAFYLDTNPDVARAGAEPLGHFLRFGAAEGRNPNPFFDCAYYRTQMPAADAASNPLVHFAESGWRRGARPSPAFDPAFYLATYEDVRRRDENPLAHFLEYGRAEGRSPAGSLPVASTPNATRAVRPLPVKLKVRTRPASPAHRVVLCATPFVPLAGRGGNHRRVYRLLKWLRLRGYRIVPVIAPLSADALDASVVAAVAAEFDNAVVCAADGRVEYLLADVPDVLASLDQEFARTEARSASAGTSSSEIAEFEQSICHGPVTATIRRLHGALRPYVFLAESVWFAGLLPSLPGPVLKVVDLLPTGPLDADASTLATWPGLDAADLLLTLGNARSADLESAFPRHQVIRVGVDSERTHVAPAAGGRRVVCDLADSAENRQALSDFLMLAWPRVRRDVPDAELVVRGVGEILEGNQLPGVLVARPGTPGADLYADAAAAISPAPNETGCRAEIVDAIAHARPVVTWSTVRCPVDIEDLGELYHPVGDWFEFARRLVELLRRTAVQVPEAGRQAIERLVSAEHAYGGLGAALDTFFDEAGIARSAGSAS